MATTGVLLHVYHLETEGWDDLAWGYPSEDRFGTVSRFAYALLTIPANERVRSIIYSGRSVKDGLTEGAYTKRFLLDRIGELDNFPTLNRYMNNLSQDEHDVFMRRIHELETGPVIDNTFDEVTCAAELFNKDPYVDKVFQISVPSHAPRCLQNQLIARQDGRIPPRQPWYVLASDVCFSGTGMNDVVILEPPHRGDDPMIGHEKTLSEVIRPYFAMDAKAKRQLIKVIHDAISKNRHDGSNESQQES